MDHYQIAETPNLGLLVKQTLPILFIGKEEVFIKSH